MKAIIAVPVTLAMIYRALSHKSLTPAGIVAATLTAAAHAAHPSSVPFTLLIVFFLAGTTVTKIKKDVKARLTISSSGNSGGEGARTHVQVFANSAVASVLSLLHAYQIHRRQQSGVVNGAQGTYPWGKDLLFVGIVANYAAVAADTFSSELGILAESRPRLITSWSLRKVPPGTNGGVTWEGLVAGLLGSFIIVFTTMALSFPKDGTELPDVTPWGSKEPSIFSWAMVIWGGLGSLLDSFLGGWLQQSVVDTRSGRIVEGDGGKKVLVSKPGQSSIRLRKGAEVKAALLSGEGENSVEIHPTSDQAVVNRFDKKLGRMTGGNKNPQTSSLGNEHPSRIVESGLSLLDNNEVNFLMALTMSLGAMGVASWYWNTPLGSILQV